MSTENIAIKKNGINSLCKLVEQVKQGPQKRLIGEQRPGSLRGSAEKSLIHLELLVPHGVLVLRGDWHPGSRQGVAQNVL